MVNLSPYGFFIIISTSNASTTTIRTTTIAIAGTKYKSAMDCAGVGIGVAVAAGSEHRTLLLL